MRTKEKNTPITSVRNNDIWSRELLRSYPEVVSYHLKKNTTDKAVAIYGRATSCNMQTANMNFQHYADDPVAKSCKVAKVYDEETRKDVFIEGIHAFMLYSLHHYWAQNPEADLVDFAIWAEFFLYFE